MAKKQTRPVIRAASAAEILDHLGAPTRSIRVSRTHGDVIIDIFRDEDPRIGSFLAWASAWWSSQPEQLGLLDAPSIEDENARFIREVAVRKSDGDYTPAIYRVIPAPKRGKAPTDADVLLPATIGRRTIGFAITGAQEHGEAWDRDPAALEVFMADGGASATVTLRPFSAAVKGVAPADRDEQLQEALRAWKEIDQDTLDILVNNFLRQLAAGELTPEGWAYLAYNTVLDLRGIAKKTARKKSEEKTYTSGHRAEDRAEIHRSVLRLYNMGADVGMKEERGRRRGRSSPVITIQNTDFVESADGVRETVGIWYTLGAWASTVTEHRVLMPGDVLAFHPERESIEKRLGRLLPILLASSIHPTGLAIRRIGDVFRELHLPIDERNPGRTQSRFTKALDTLQARGVIGSWSIDPDPRTRPLPARGFLEHWLARSLVVAPNSRPRALPDARV